VARMLEEEGECDGEERVRACPSGRSGEDGVDRSFRRWIGVERDEGWRLHDDDDAIAVFALMDDGSILGVRLSPFVDLGTGWYPVTWISKLVQPAAAV